MDRERLKEVHASDLTEGRINQDFVDWLQTKGMTWLLVILVALCAYFGIVRWRHSRTNYQTEAWRGLATATLPGAYEDVAEKYSDVGSVAHLARLRAAEMLLTSVQTSQVLGAETETTKELTPADRDDYLNRADRLYAKVLESDNGAPGTALLMVTAHTGRAAVAESKGDLEQAKQYYTKAAERAQSVYPRLAEQAKLRAESVDLQASKITLPSQAELATMFKRQKPPESLEPVTMDQWVRELVLPQS
jgi:hypothetical protein